MAARALVGCVKTGTRKAKAVAAVALAGVLTVRALFTAGMPMPEREFARAKPAVERIAREKSGAASGKAGITDASGEFRLLQSFEVKKDDAWERAKEWTAEKDIVTLSGTQGLFWGCATAGIQRIELEMLGSPETGRYVCQYESVVKTVAARLAMRGVGPADYEGFIRETHGMLFGEFKIKTGNFKTTLYRCLDTKEFDCDPSAFLVYDIAKMRGMDASLVLAPGHVFVKVGDLAFETTQPKLSRAYFSTDEMKDRYPRIYAIISDPFKAQSITYLHMGNLCAKNLEEQYEFFRRAAEITPGYAGAYVNTGLLYSRHGEPDKARAYYLKALSVDPEHALALSLLGDLERRNGSYAEATEHYEKSAKIDPKRPENYYGLGVISEKAGQYEDAGGFDGG